MKPAPDSARRTVLVFAGADPSGGAGIAADILAVAAQGEHALPVITALTVQDNDRVYEVLPVDSDVVRRQAVALINKVPIDAVKIGIPGNRANAWAIAQLIGQLRLARPDLPVVLDPVLASGAGDALTHVDALAPLLPLASVIVPNLPEAKALCPGGASVAEQAAGLRALGGADVLVTGGHAEGELVVNRWFGRDGERDWYWPRLPDAFHGSGCTLASAIAARLACGDGMERALGAAQQYCHHALAHSFAIAEGQRIPLRDHATNIIEGAP
ncbi:MAG TPA: hydroxymethylpyrimidine/phosphomethylpyrimidine kinase [Telluria sp.]